MPDLLTSCEGGTENSLLASTTPRRSKSRTAQLTSSAHLQAPTKEIPSKNPGGPLQFSQPETVIRSGWTSPEAMGQPGRDPVRRPARTGEAHDPLFLCEPRLELWGTTLPPPHTAHKLPPSSARISGQGSARSRDPQTSVLPLEQQSVSGSWISVKLRKADEVIFWGVWGQEFAGKEVHMYM